MNRVIFLDIDGVLINAKSKTTADPHCVACLNTITDKTGAAIVVSSTWRKAGLESVREQLQAWGVTGEIIDITPDLSRIAPDSQLHIAATRGTEIQQWLDDNQVEGNFIILDDDADMEHLRYRLIRTHYTIGLDIDHVARAVELLTEVHHKNLFDFFNYLKQHNLTCNLSDPKVWRPDGSVRVPVRERNTQ